MAQTMPPLVEPDDTLSPLGEALVRRYAEAVVRGDQAAAKKLGGQLRTFAALRGLIDDIDQSRSLAEYMAR